jgi:hypothetical protein
MNPRDHFPLMLYRRSRHRDVLPKLAKRAPDDLLGHVATCKSWRWFDGRSIYQTFGELYVRFSAFPS